MNELQVKTVELSPAKVEFNFNELSAVLDDQLAKYEGLEFTEKDAAECKKTITELNKGKKSLDTYRKETKKELSVEITEFEKQCKELGKKFDSVISPLKEQYEEFEEERKAKKRSQIAPIIESLIEKEGLNKKYINQLIDIPKEYFNKSKSIKAIKAELTTKAEHLGIQQDKEEADQEVIKSYVELVNAKENVNLPESAFTGLLGYKEVVDIKAQIESAAQAEKEKQYEKVPLSEAPGHDEESYDEVYQVTGTEEQLSSLEEYMSSQSITWKVVEE
ncbi:DUF1351 domain-containing protein [Virgibacillus halodenitrificans]|nr:DUF1351 domain-containing protein [Virgibacillus halodenitrificans]